MRQRGSYGNVSTPWKDLSAGLAVSHTRSANAPPRSMTCTTSVPRRSRSGFAAASLFSVRWATGAPSSWNPSPAAARSATLPPWSTNTPGSPSTRFSPSESQWSPASASQPSGCRSRASRRSRQALQAVSAESAADGVGITARTARATAATAGSGRDVGMRFLRRGARPPPPASGAGVYVWGMRLLRALWHPLTPVVLLGVALPLATLLVPADWRGWAVVAAVIGGPLGAIASVVALRTTLARIPVPADAPA